MIGFKIQIREVADLSKYSVDELLFYRTQAPEIAHNIWSRIERGFLPTGRRTAPLSKRYQKVKAKYGRSPIRNFSFRGNMKRAMYASITKTKGLRFAFSGTITTLRELRGSQRDQRWRMQQLADKLAKASASGRPASWAKKGAAPHTFMALNAEDMRELTRELQKVLVDAYIKLPKKRGK